MEVKDTAIHTEFYWQANIKKVTEDIGYFRKRNQSMALTLPHSMWKKCINRILCIYFISAVFSDSVLVYYIDAVHHMS